METTDQKLNKKMKRLLLLLNTLLLTIGSCGGPLIMRLYFLHGGKRVWLSSWLQTGGWPINFIPLIITYFHRRRKNGPTTKLIVIKPPVLIAATVIGILTGLDDYLYAYGLAWLPVSTSSLIIASQLGFTALFAFLLVRQKFTSYTINAVVLLTVGAGILALHSSGDRPKGESNRKYYLGFFMTIAAAALYGLILPMVELTYKKAKQAITYTLVLEIQLVMCFFATLVCTVGMLINKDFQLLSSLTALSHSLRSLLTVLVRSFSSYSLSFSLLSVAQLTDGGSLTPFGLCSRFWPINIPCRWNSSTMMPNEHPMQQEMPYFVPCSRSSHFDDQFPQSEHIDNFRISHFGFSRLVSSPEMSSIEPNSYRNVKVSMDDLELNSPSSVVSSLCQDHEVKTSKVKYKGWGEQEMEQEEDEVMSSYVIEINADHREGTEEEALGVDEAIAWAKEKFYTHHSDQIWSKCEKDQSADAEGFSDGQMDRQGATQSLLEEEPNKWAPEGRELEKDMEMEVLDEGIRLWSASKEANIRLLLSTLHQVQKMDAMFNAAAFAVQLCMKINGCNDSQRTPCLQKKILEYFNGYDDSDISRRFLWILGDMFIIRIQFILYFCG